MSYLDVLFEWVSPFLGRAAQAAESPQHGVGWHSTVYSIALEGVCISHEVPEVTNCRKIKIAHLQFLRFQFKTRWEHSLRYFVGMPHGNGGEHAMVLRSKGGRRGQGPQILFEAIPQWYKGLYKAPDHKDPDSPDSVNPRTKSLMMCLWVIQIMQVLKMK